MCILSIKAFRVGRRVGGLTSYVARLIPSSFCLTACSSSPVVPAAAVVAVPRLLLSDNGPMAFAAVCIRSSSIPAPVQAWSVCSGLIGMSFSMTLVFGARTFETVEPIVSVHMQSLLGVICAMFAHVGRLLLPAVRLPEFVLDQQQKRRCESKAALSTLLCVASAKLYAVALHV
jgi:hypothetical protein